jgi:hypothetical protein
MPKRKRPKPLLPDSPDGGPVLTPYPPYPWLLLAGLGFQNPWTGFKSPLKRKRGRPQKSEIIEIRGTGQVTRNGSRIIEVWRGRGILDLPETVTAGAVKQARIRGRKRIKKEKARIKGAERKRRRFLSP